MQMRLQKALAQAGVASRRKAEELIVEGRVEVNGRKVRELGTQVDPDSDLIRVNGKLLEPEKKVYFVFFKPPGVVTTLSDPQGRATVADFLEQITERVFAVGRLDFDAEGALILTNDGELANQLMHPRYEVPRVYMAKVKGQPDAETLAMLRSGVRLEDGMVRPAEVEVGAHAEKNTWIKLVLTEGRPHLVKRLCAAIGHPVVRLYRPMYGGVSAEGLAPGRYRPLSPAEVSLLRAGGNAPIPSVNAIKPPPRRHRAEEGEAAPSRPARSERPAAAEVRPTGGARGGRTGERADGRSGEGRGFQRGEEGRVGRAPARRSEGRSAGRAGERSGIGGAGKGRSEGRSAGRAGERSGIGGAGKGRSEGRSAGRAGESRFAGERSGSGGAAKGRSEGRSAGRAGESRFAGERSGFGGAAKGRSEGRSAGRAGESRFAGERSGFGGAGKGRSEGRSTGKPGESRFAGERSGFGVPSKGRTERRPAAGRGEGRGFEKSGERRPAGGARGFGKSAEGRGGGSSRPPSRGGERTGRGAASGKGRRG